MAIAHFVWPFRWLGENLEKGYLSKGVISLRFIVLKIVGPVMLVAFRISMPGPRIATTGGIGDNSGGLPGHEGSSPHRGMQLSCFVDFYWFVTSGRLEMTHPIRDDSRTRPVWVTRRPWMPTTYAEHESTPRIISFPIPWMNVDILFYSIYY